MHRERIRNVLFVGFALACLTGYISPPVALACGVCLTLALGQAFHEATHRTTKWLLQASVVGLGFGLNLAQVWAAGKMGFGFTVATIAGTLALGWLVGRALNVDSQVSCLVSAGTAICGGSAIAAVGAVLKADKKAMSVALGTVFVLNAIGLFIFPPLGRALGLTQQQFGLWSAIAIHDTSSVVGAASRYGEEALRLATTVKLGRALWIIPLVIGLSWVTRRKGARITVPWFIFGFVLAAGIRTLFPQGVAGYQTITAAAKLGLTLTLFFIGTGLSREAIQTVGVKAMVQGVALWVVVSLAGLAAVHGLIPG